MKKMITGVFSVCLLALLSIATTYPAAAAGIPSADVSMSISNIEKTDDGMILIADIAVSKPSAPYASLDFNLITDNKDTLSIVDLNDDPKKTELDITFAKGFGKAYHNGQNDSASGGYRYLIGIYSTKAGNLINDEVKVCSARFKYTGDSSQTIKIRDMKLVYVDTSGAVKSVPVKSNDAYLIVGSDLLVNLNEQSSPLSAEPGYSSSMMVVVVIIVAVLLLVIAVLFFTRRKIKTALKSRNVS